MVACAYIEAQTSCASASMLGFVGLKRKGSCQQFAVCMCGRVCGCVCVCALSMACMHGCDCLPAGLAQLASQTEWLYALLHLAGLR